MLTIKQMLEGKIGEPFGGCEKAIKTYKKIWQDDKGIYYQQVILMDNNGEIPADVKLGDKYNPLRGRVSLLRIVVAEIQEAEYLGKDRRKLIVHEWAVGDPYHNESDPTALSPYEEHLAGIDSPRVVRGKIKCWLVAAKIQSGAKDEDVEDFSNSEILTKIIDNVMKG